MGKYSFKFRLDKQTDSNEFINENLVFIDIKDVTMEQVVKLLNLSLNTPLKVKKPKFEVFNPEEEPTHE
jgi:hypothetical protein